MDDAINTTWQQPNTFMDIISPNAQSPSPRATPKKSSTLMRSAVKKPEAKSISIADIQAGTSAPELPTISAPHTDLSEAATLTDRSPLISRFSANTDFNPAVSAPPDVQQPAVDDLSSVTPYPSMDGPSQMTDSYEAPTESQPLAADQAVAIEQPVLNVFKNSSLASYGYNEPSRKIDWNILKRISGWTVLAIAVIGIVGGGLLINRNFSKLELYMASSRAGFSATLPSIKPSGYDLNGISTASGVIEASYKSNSDNRNYSISEKKSTLSNSALLDGYVTNQAGLNYQSVKTTDGLTLYIYNGHDATWVSKGIWYVVQDNNSLSDNQIINIANSM